MTYNQTHLSMLNEGVDKWNAWRADCPEVVPELRVAPLAGRDLRGINLQGAILTGAELNEAMLENAKLQRARLDRANLEGARLRGAHMEDASLKGALLGGADLRAAFLSNATNLEGACLWATDSSGHMTCLVDVDWASVNLGVVDWETVQEIGDEQQARQKPSTENYRAATRAYRQLAVELRNQGMGEEADRFAYKAQLLQRIVYRRQKKWSRFATSWFLDRLAGYGYKPGRSLFIYAFIILFFAALYCVVPNNSSIRGPLSSIWWQALLFSILSFHGRIQPPTNMNIDYTFSWLAAIEAIFGLLIEITFIATFTQRFFAKETR
jgi:Pentapeptide repeats (8 copies)